MSTDVAKADAFPTRLREFRRRAGLTQAELAERAGLNQFTVAKLEQNERKPEWGTVLRLADALGVTPNDFVGEDESQDAAPPPKRKPGRPKGTSRAGSDNVPRSTFGADDATESVAGDEEIATEDDVPRSTFGADDATESGE